MIARPPSLGIPLTELPEQQRARIIAIHGGRGFQHRLHVMGIMEGRIVTIVSKQPFRGPITIRVNGTHMTLGRGMARKIIVEVIP
ncbi:MAG TPA: ferrous iron transport protein A [Thermoplasmatales archaeon]|nr:ferrous iron transport protein A [Thermoplasmatales archaeon]